ncbi:MAG: hypothetical protein NVSMB65_00430 [Chloroflexota bacterium]
MQPPERRSPSRVTLPLRPRRPGEYDLAGLPVTRRAGNVFAYRISTPLARYCAAWMARLGLEGVACYLAGDELPVEVGGEMWLACVAERELVAVNLRSPQEFVQRARTGDFDLLMITVALRQLKKGAGYLCPLCRHHAHPLVHHIILHELVHAVAPERAWDNPWTDRHVAELLANASHHTTATGQPPHTPVDAPIAAPQLLRTPSECWSSGVERSPSRGAHPASAPDPAGG